MPDVAMILILLVSCSRTLHHLWCHTLEVAFDALQAWGLTEQTWLWHP